VFLLFITTTTTTTRQQQQQQQGQQQQQQGGQQQQQGHRRQGRRGQGQGQGQGQQTTPMDKVAVFISQLQHEGAREILKACKNRGMRVAPVSLCEGQNQKVQCEGANVECINARDEQNAVKRLQEEVNKIKQSGMTPVAIDSDPRISFANIYNQVGLGFVTAQTGSEIQQQIQKSQNRAVIGPYVSREMLLLDDMLSSFSRRNRGLWNDYELVWNDWGTASPSFLLDPSYHQRLLDSFSLLMDQELVPSMRTQQAQGGEAVARYQIKDRNTGTTTYEFHDTIGDKPVAEAVADAAGYLADQIATGMQPRIYQMHSLLDWPRLPLLA